MYELKKFGQLLASKSFGTGPSSYERRIYRDAVSQSLRNTAVVVTSLASVGNFFPLISNDSLLFNN